MIRFAHCELTLAARRVVYRLRRMKASGIYGDDHGHHNCWDEFCYEVENGPTSALEWAWDATVQPLISDVVNRLPEHVALFLSWHLASFEEEEPDEAIRDDLLGEGILSAMKEMAGGWR